MLRGKSGGALAGALALLSLLGGVSQAAIVELVAVGPSGYTHELTVNVGDTVQIAYLIADADNLSFFQDDLQMTGPGTDLTLLVGQSWWEQQLNCQPDTLVNRGGGLYTIIGESSISDRPYSHDVVEPNSLALFEFSCTDLGDVVIEGLLKPYFASADPDTMEPGPPIIPDPALSNAVVVIHQVEGRQVVLSYDVTPVGAGVINGSPEGLYNVGDDIHLEAVANTDWVFVMWDELTGAGVPGDPYSSVLDFPIATDLDLLARFAYIPEPMSLTLLGIGAACLGLRSRKRRRA
jgi:hypothetical protein